ncbi:MAG: UDP-N-acetylmuramate--L-alanine ligase [Actinobacteria bacterium 13_1_40CM_66_12]|nr:MAG: UDP-N-acetylmuramate--L-alanine ligase [Actinobacteria bacterium 13_1_40CM_66_12]
MKVHLMGIGGAGVSALARVFLARGDEVSGCDVKESDTTAALEDAGVRIFIGHDPEHVLFQDLLVYSGAIKASPELDAARAMGVKVLSRAEMLAELINESDSIAVGGSAGKTTVTHMTGHILTEAGFDPTVLVGDGSSARAGRSKWLVAEVDESDGTLVLHHPKRAIVTNIEFDHPDHFKDVEEVSDLFARFVAGLPADGVAVLCADDERTRSLETPAKRITYGFSQDADYRCGEGRPFAIHHGGHELGRGNLRQPGRHNVQNATAAAAMALELGVSFADVAGALERFPGAHRRLEFLGVFQGAPVYDDYAHHPTKVRATLQAAREMRHRRLIVVFQPHRFSRLAALIRDFSRSFTDADRVLVLDVYSAGEDNPTGIQARDLADLIPNGIYVGSFERAREALEGLVGRDDVLLLMGAGDIRKLGDELAQRV